MFVSHLGGDPKYIGPYSERSAQSEKPRGPMRKVSITTTSARKPTISTRYVREDLLNGLANFVVEIAEIVSELAICVAREAGDIA